MDLTRRNFLKGGAALALGASVLPRLRAAEAPRKGISIGYSLYGMKTVPLIASLADCRDIGYESVELCLNPGFPAQPSALSAGARKEVRRWLVASNYRVSALMCDMALFTPGAQGADLDAIRRAADLARAVVPGPMPVIESVLGGKAPDWESAKSAAADRLRQWGETAASEGITIAVKAHAGAAVNSPDRLLWLIQTCDHPSIRVNYDYSHFRVGGYDLEESIRALAPYIRLVHMKDAEGTDEKPRFLLAGDGRTDFVRYFGTLEAVGYSGPAIVEVSAQVFNQPGYDPLASARKVHAFLERELRRAESGR